MINILQHYVKHTKVAAYVSFLHGDHPYLVVESVYFNAKVLIFFQADGASVDSTTPSSTPSEGMYKTL